MTKKMKKGRTKQILAKRVDIMDIMKYMNIDSEKARKFVDEIRNEAASSRRNSITGSDRLNK